MIDPPILFVKPGSVKPKDKRTLARAGVIVIEVQEPGEMKFARASSDIDGSALLRAAADAISKTGYGNAREAFGVALCAAIKDGGK